MAGSDQAYVLIRALIARYQFVPPEEEEEVTGIQMSRRALSARCGCGCGWVWVYVWVGGWVGGCHWVGGWVGGCIQLFFSQMCWYFVAWRALSTKMDCVSLQYPWYAC